MGLSRLNSFNPLDEWKDEREENKHLGFKENRSLEGGITFEKFSH